MHPQDVLSGKVEKHYIRFSMRRGDSYAKHLFELDCWYSTHPNSRWDVLRTVAEQLQRALPATNVQRLQQMVDNWNLNGAGPELRLQYSAEMMYWVFEFATPYDKRYVVVEEVVQSGDPQQIFSNAIQWLQYDGTSAMHTGGVVPAVYVPQQSVVQQLSAVFDLDQQARCQECKRTGALSWAVQHLNDTHKWKRDKIAAWLEEQDLDIQARVSSH